MYLPPVISWNPHHNSFYLSFTIPDCIRTLWREEGLCVFAKGLIAGVIASTICFIAIIFGNESCQEDNRSTRIQVHGGLLAVIMCFTNTPHPFL